MISRAKVSHDAKLWSLSDIVRVIKNWGSERSVPLGDRPVG